MARVSFTLPSVIYVGAPCPTIYDISQDICRPVTQADVDALVDRAGEAVNLRISLLLLLGLPSNAKAQIDRIAELGGVYRLARLVDDMAALS